jgi:hypothetical protein
MELALLSLYPLVSSSPCPLVTCFVAGVSPKPPIPIIIVTQAPGEYLLTEFSTKRLLSARYKAFIPLFRKGDKRGIKKA